MKNHIRICVTTLVLLAASTSIKAAPPSFPGLGAPGDLTEIVFEQGGESILRGKNARQ